MGCGRLGGALDHLEATFLAGRCSHIDAAAVFQDGHDAPDPTEEGPTSSKTWNAVQQETNTTTREELEKMDPEEALTYVTTPGGGPLTLEDVQAKLTGLGSFKSHPYETTGATGVRDALIAEIVKSVKSGMRGESLVDEKASHGALTRTKSQGSNPGLTLAQTASVPDDGDAVQQGLVLKLMTENAQLRQRAEATESSGVQGALATLPEDFAEALANVGKQTRRASMGAVSSMMRILSGWLEEQLESEPHPRPEAGKLCAARNPPTLSCAISFRVRLTLLHDHDARSASRPAEQEPNTPALELAP